VLITIKNRINLAPKHAPSQPKTLNRQYVTLGREVAVRIGCSLIPGANLTRYRSFQSPSSAAPVTSPGGEPHRR